MKLKEAVRERRSVRHFKAEPVPHEVIMEIMEDVRFVPSWKNTQVARYYLVEDPAIKARFDEGEFCYGFTYNAGTLKRAPQVMVMAYKKGISGHEKDGSNATPKGDDFWEAFDCGIAAQTFCLLAHERGIGTVIQGYFDDAMIAEALNIPEGFSIGAVIPMGYIDEESKTPVRKEAGELITFI